MAIERIRNPKSILKAIKECDRLGRDAFLNTYGFGRSRVYFLVHNGHSYDSKAIVAVAYGYEFPRLGPLSPAAFSGGEATVGKLLTKLGFQVKRLSEPMPAPGDILSNEQLMRAMGVGLQGGMRRSKKQNLLVLISDPTKALYDDQWIDEVFHFTGMGKKGDQKLTTQNRTLAESSKTGVTLHLFEVFKPGEYTYEGEVELVGKPYTSIQADIDGQKRRVFVFPLQLKDTSNILVPEKKNLDEINKSRERKLRKKSLRQLRVLAQMAERQSHRRSVTTQQYSRSSAVVAYVKKAANGFCDLCENPAPFNSGSEPYLECHHIKPLADGGIDHISNAVALCPNCHRKMHIVRRATDIKALTNKVLSRDR